MFKLNRPQTPILTIIKVILEAKSNVSLQSKIKIPEKAIISCKRNQYNFYNNQTYNKFDEIPLASKGWDHSKSKGDYFVVHPDENAFDKPIHSFNDIGINPKIIQALHDAQITQATNFQFKAIPVMKSGKNIMLTAETGCGKTISYLVPIIDSIMGNNTKEMNTPKALILIPNRELAYQIGTVAKQLADAVGLKIKVIVGGRTKKIMMNPEFDNIDILIGTPGAIGKLSTVGIYKLNQVEYTVLDEADTLIDDSFIERMESLLKRVSQSQITLVSATCPKKLPVFLESFEQNMIHIKSDRLHRPLMTITQRFLRLIRSSKPSQLLSIAKNNKDPLLVFTNRNQTCNWLAMFLRENGLKCANINGDMNYSIRIAQWNDFANGDALILSATDVGSRGLDTTQVKHVINYDFPLYAADYIHRIGRTGRLGSPESSKVTNFISGTSEIKLVQQIELAIRKNAEIPNVDGNITNLVQTKILRKFRDNV